MAWTERYVTTTGAGAHDGTSEANAWTLAEAITNGNAGHRINVKAGTYANTTTSRTFGAGAGAGTTTSPKWWRGYTSAIGDLDTSPSATRTPGTDFPLFTFTSGVVSVSSAHQWFSNIEFRGTAPGGTFVSISGSKVKFHRCRFDCQEASSTSYTVRASADGGAFSECYFKGTSSVNYVVISEERNSFHGSYFLGGGVGLNLDIGSGGGPCRKCIFDSCGSHGVLLTGNASYYTEISQCSFYNCGGDGIRIATAIPAGLAIIENILNSCGGYGINNSTGTNTNVPLRLRNLFYNNTSGKENGFGDSPSLFEYTDSASSFVDAPGDDFTPASASNAVGKGMPGLFEGL